jgi:hypothetical protein
MMALHFPHRIIEKDRPPKTRLSESMRWLQENSKDYLHQWVALQGAELLASAPTRKELVAQVRDRFTSDGELRIT